MLSKEEIEEALRIGDDRIVREYINQLETENYNLKIISKTETEQREQLESDKQKLIEKLEKDIEKENIQEKNQTSTELSGIKKLYAQKILELAKGEKK